MFIIDYKIFKFYFYLIFVLGLFILFANLWVKLPRQGKTVHFRYSEIFVGR